MKKILVILGSTSSGKSDIAIKLAKKFNGEIISADSRQIYRGMDVGTGKVPKSKVKSKKLKDIYISHGIPHHMIDIVSPRTDFNVAKFKKQSENFIEDIKLFFYYIGCDIFYYFTVCFVFVCRRPIQHKAII